MKKILCGVARGQGAGKVAGYAVWRDGAMTTPLLARIAATVEDARSRGPDRLGLSAAQLGTLEEIAAARAELACLIGRLVCAGLVPSEAESVVVASALEALAAGEASGAGTLPARTWRRCRAVLRREHRFAARHLVMPVPDALVPAASTPDGFPAVLFARAVASMVISRREAELIALTRFAGCSLTELASAWGTPLAALASIRRRAEARLRVVLEQEEEGPRCEA